MKLSMGTNFDDELLHMVKDSAVKTIYGKLQNDIFGGGRPSMALPEISKEDLKRHISLAHSYGIEFNYLMNTNCMDNLEFKSDFNSKLFETIEWLNEIGVDWITVSIPYMVEVIKKVAPQIKVSLSTFAYVDTLQKALEFEKLGVDEITLPEGLNRNFELLKTLRKNLKCQIQLIATNLCLSACPYRFYHANSQSHASQKGHVSQGITFDYCMLKCTEKTMRDPVEAIKAPWIRPEDVSEYEAIGIDNIKITERMKKTEVLSEIVHAYTNRSYPGMLSRLLNFRVKEDFIQPRHDMIVETDEYNKAYIFKSRELLFQRKIEIDNKKLDGFITHFVNSNKDCRNIVCGVECRHCYNYAEKAVKVDSKELICAADNIAELIEDVTSGALFKSNEMQPQNWSNELLQMLDKFLVKKPEFVRESARVRIKEDCEKIAKDEKRNTVSIEDLVKANFMNTPKEFRKDFVAEIEQLGLNIELQI